MLQKICKNLAQCCKMLQIASKCCLRLQYIAKCSQMLHRVNNDFTLTYLLTQLNFGAIWQKSTKRYKKTKNTSFSQLFEEINIFFGQLCQNIRTYLNRSKLIQQRILPSKNQKLKIALAKKLKKISKNGLHLAQQTF